MSDHWDFYAANVNDKLAFLFFDVDAFDLAPNAQRPWLLWTWVYFNDPREDGLCHTEEADVLFQMEDALREAIDNALDAEMVGRITTDGRREFYFYAPTFEGYEDLVSRELQAFPAYRFETGTKLDAEWTQYLNLLYPTPRDWQRIKNRHVLDALQERGDPLEQARPVFHWAYFRDEDAREKFIEKATKQGFSVDGISEADEPDLPYPYGVKLQRIDEVDWDSINTVTLELYELAHSLDGDYDGWETSVETGNE